MLIHLVIKKVYTDRAGTYVFYELSSTFSFTALTRDSFYLNGGQSNTAQSIDGSITEITVSNQLLTWDECFNYTASRSILSGDAIKENNNLLKDVYFSKSEMSKIYNNLPNDTTTGIYRFSGSTNFTSGQHMELTTNSGDISMPAPSATYEGATLSVPLDTPLDMSGFLVVVRVGFHLLVNSMFLKFTIVMQDCFHGVFLMY